MSSLILNNSYTTKVDPLDYKKTSNKNEGEISKKSISENKSDYIKIDTKKGDLFKNIFDTDVSGTKTFAKLETDRKNNTILNIQSIPSETTKEEFIGILKNEISRNLVIESTGIKIFIDKNDIFAINTTTNNKIRLDFDDKDDKKRFQKYISLSSDNNLSNLGNNNNVKNIRITNYEDALTKESQIQLFKEDISRNMKTEIKSIEIMIVDNTIYTINKNNKNIFQIDFSDNKDAERFIKYANESKSKRLEDFGLKKSEVIASVGGSTSFAKGTNTIGENITYSRFLGESGTQKIKVIANTDFNLNSDPNEKNIKDITVYYENSELPLVNSYGNVQLSYKEGKIKVDGKLDYIDMQVDKVGKKLEKQWKEDKKKVILEGVGALALVGATAYAGTKLLKKEQEIDAPITTKLYDNGMLEVRAGVGSKITIGNDKFKVNMKRANIELKQNIASGTNLRESIKYDIEEKKLETEIEANYDRTNLKIKNNTSFKNSDENSTYISLGKSHTISDKVNLSYSYSQELDKNFNPKNSSLNVGVEYNPSEDWRLNAGGGISLATPNSKVNYNGNIRITKKFY